MGNPGLVLSRSVIFWGLGFCSGRGPKRWRCMWGICGANLRPAVSRGWYRRCAGTATCCVHSRQFPSSGCRFRGRCGVGLGRSRFGRDVRDRAGRPEFRGRSAAAVADGRSVFEELADGSGARRGPVGGVRASVRRVRAAAIAIIGRGRASRSGSIPGSATHKGSGRPAGGSSLCRPRPWSRRATPSTSPGAARSCWRRISGAVGLRSPAGPVRSRREMPSRSLRMRRSTGCRCGS